MSMLIYLDSRTDYKNKCVECVVFSGKVLKLYFSFRWNCCDL